MSPKYNHAVSVSFSVETAKGEDDLLRPENLNLLVAKLCQKLTEIIENKDISSFEVYDTYEVDKDAS